MSHPLLKVDENAIKKELNIGKFIGQVLLGVAVGLTVRKIIEELDAWKERKKLKK
jgi:hypothetical protein